MGDISETESDTSSVMGDASEMKPPSPASREALSKRLETLLGENSRLRIELEGQRFRVKTLQQENKSLKHASVLIQAKAEQEEEFISNTLLKKIQELKKEKEALALNYEQEEEFLTNDLSRKLFQLRNEKAELAHTLQQEQESLVNKLMRRIQKLESETNTKQANLEQLRREKVELENTLEQEQEALVNRLWKRMDRLEAEKRCAIPGLQRATCRSLQERMDPSLVTAPPSPMDVSTQPTGSGQSRTGAPRLGSDSSTSISMASRTTSTGMVTASSESVQLVRHIQQLRDEVLKLKLQLASSDSQHVEKTAQLAREEQHMREENLRLRRKLELEVERRQELCRHLSESESSLEMEDERHFNEMSVVGAIPAPPASAVVAASATPSGGGNVGGTSAIPRGRTISSPNPVAFVPGSTRSISPATLGALSVTLPNTSASSLPTSQISPGPSTPLLRCPQCGWPVSSLVSPSAVWGGIVSSTPIAPVALNSAAINNSNSSMSSQNPGSVQRTKSTSGGGRRGAPSADHFARPAPPTTPKAASPAPASPRAPSGGEPMDFSSTSNSPSRR